MNVTEYRTSKAALALASEYVNILYLHPSTKKGDPNIKPLKSLLRGAEIYLMRDGDVDKLTFKQIKNKLYRGYYSNILNVDVKNINARCDNVGPKVCVNTIETWDGNPENRPAAIKKSSIKKNEEGSYVINATILFEIEKKKGKLYIAKVFHVFDSTFFPLQPHPGNSVWSVFHYETPFKQLEM